MICEHTVKVRARNISCCIRNGHLIGHEALGPKEKKPVPMEYDFVDFCQQPTCEKVFKAERKESE